MNDHTNWLKTGDAGKSRRQVLEARHLIKRAVREFLHKQGFLEIDTPLLVHGTTPDAMIESFRVGDRYLVTSTEYQIRRLEAGGFERFYTLTQNFRAGDVGPYRYRGHATIQPTLAFAWDEV